MKLLLILLCISLNALAIDQKTIDKIQKILDLQTQNRMHVGISVGLVEGDQTHIINSGYKDLSNKILLSNADYFSIGSVSKTFTSLLLAVAVDKGLVSIDEKVKNLLPEFLNNKAGNITLRQLSTHTSGLQRDPTQLSSSGVFLPFENYKRSQLIYEVLNAKYIEIKDREEYSNLGIGLLSLCLEEIYGENFDSAIYTHVLNPLGLGKILVNLESEELPLMSKKYFPSLDEVPVWSKLGILNGAGSFKATTDLMIKYIQAQIDPASSILEDAIKLSQQPLHKFSKESIAYAWFILKKPIGKILFHNGSTAGFSTDVFIAPKKQKGLVILSNTRAKVECVAAIFMVNKDCTPKEMQIDNEDTLNEYDSLYLIEKKNINIRIKQKGNGVLTLYFAQQKIGVRLFKSKRDHYSFYGTDGKVEFLRNALGKVEGLNFGQVASGVTYKYKAIKL